MQQIRSPRHSEGVGEQSSQRSFRHRHGPADFIGRHRVEAGGNAGFFGGNGGKGGNGAPGLNGGIGGNAGFFSVTAATAATAVRAAQLPADSAVLLAARDEEATTATTEAPAIPEPMATSDRSPVIAVLAAVFGIH